MSARRLSPGWSASRASSCRAGSAACESPPRWRDGFWTSSATTRKPGRQRSSNARRDESEGSFPKSGSFCCARTAPQSLCVVAYRRMRFTLLSQTMKGHLSRIAVLLFFASVSLVGLQQFQWRFRPRTLSSRTEAPAEILQCPLPRTAKGHRPKRHRAGCQQLMSKA